MKKSIIILLAVLLGSCATVPQEKLEKLEEMIQAQNETLNQIDHNISRLKQTEDGETVDEQPAEEPAEQPVVQNQTIIKQYELGDKIIVGEQEMIYINPPGISVIARIDTGAATSSIHGSDIQWFERDGKKWVRFNMDHDGVDRIMEKPVQEIKTIRQSSSPEPVDRAVIKLNTVLGGVETETEFTLADRSHMTYPVLIGRTLIRDLMIVDVAHEFLHGAPENN
ncbi:MAG: ATP-dependent zinc protease [Spirochaetales bacterium]|nr:ATP-dependent zinc protease [Spirochaetales bacterium]